MMTNKLFEKWGLTLFFVGVQIGLLFIMIFRGNVYSCVASIVFIPILIWANLIRLSSLRKGELAKKKLEKIIKESLNRKKEYGCERENRDLYWKL